jgi:hypothetical protein
MRELSEIEEKTYNFIKDADEVQTTNLPNERMCGAVPNLEKMGLVQVFKKYTSNFRSRKRKFVKVKD